MKNPHGYFVMVNKKTRARLLCSYKANQPDYFNQKVNYIGIQSGLGGYNSMINLGWYDRRDFKQFDQFDYLKSLNLPPKYFKFKINVLNKYD